MEYCKFQRISSIEGRLLGCLLRQLAAIRTAVFNDSYTQVSLMEKSDTPLSIDAPLSDGDADSNNPFSS